MSAYSKLVIRQILQEAGSDWDFEDFCVAIFTRIDGVNYLPTSRTHDLGADGRAVTKSMRGDYYIISSMQDVDLVNKADRDLRRLIGKNNRIAKIRICLSRLKSEEVRSQIERKARHLCKNITIEVSGITQLIDYVEHNSEPFEEVYDHHVDEARRQNEPIDRSPEKWVRLGFRVLLATQITENAKTLRHSILRDLVLQSTRQDTDVSREDIVAGIVDAIGLHRPIHSSYVTPVLESLVADGLIQVSPGGIRRNRAADHTLELSKDAAATGAIVGMGAFKRAIELRLEKRVASGDFKKIWSVTRRGLIKLFQRYGVQVVDFIQAIGETGAAVSTHDIPETILDDLNRIACDLDVLELSEEADIDELVCRLGEPHQVIP